jgi:hypothetical protein
MLYVLVENRASESRYGVLVRRVLALALALLGKQDLVKTFTEALMELSVDGGAVGGGNFIFEERVG